MLDGKFQIEKALASGASGDVYEAEHLGLGARVAVKVLRPGAPTTREIRRKRFVREARVAARLQSDHVVRVYDIVAPLMGPTYIVMELLQGETLQERVQRRGPLPIAEAVDAIVQAAKPLAEMHDLGIVHRDVKPSNLFVVRDKDGNERVKLLDFGVAAFQQGAEPAREPANSSLTLTEAVVGTPRYMAPEQVRSSRDVDARTDVWALGVTLYVLLAGRPPFDGETVLAVLNQIENQEPPRLSSLRAEVPPALEAIVRRCLAKQPAQRPADARALFGLLVPFASSRVTGHPRPPSALDLSLHDEDIEVVPPPPSAPATTAEPSPASRRGTRRRWAVGVASAALVLAVVGVAARRTSTTEEPAPAPTVPVGVAPTSAPAVPASPLATGAPASASAPSSASAPAPVTAATNATTATTMTPAPPRTATAAAPERATPARRPKPRPAPPRSPKPPTDDDRIE